MLFDAKPHDLHFCCILFLVQLLDLQIQKGGRMRKRPFLYFYQDICKKFEQLHVFLVETGQICAMITSDQKFTRILREGP